MKVGINMRLMIASDIHGSAYYCNEMINRFMDEEADKLLLLGDILYHGPRNDLPLDYDPKKVIELLNPLKDKIIAVRGNCDAQVDQMVLDFPIMADYIMLLIDDIEIYATHGHIYNQDKPIFGAKIILYGHTHIPDIEEKEGIKYLNPGSVSIPKNNTLHSYMVYEDHKFIWKDLLTEKEYQFLEI